MINSNLLHTEKLFSYGTLRYETVQLATFGRKLTGKADVLTGYRLSMIPINDPDVIETSGEAEHPIIQFTNDQQDQVNGIVFDVSIEELKQADSYEVAEYKRVSVQLKSGLSAWVYVNAVENLISID